MPAKKRLPYGTWPSPISAAAAAKASRRFGMVQAAGGAVYWSESRPEQGGRQAILRADAGGAVEDLLPAPFSARSRVHEYGGGEFLAVGPTVYFVNDKDQDVYALEPGRPPQRITSAPSTRLADFAHDTARDRLIAVAEIHESAGRALPRNALVAIALSGARGQITELATGRDFYASPRLSADGRSLAFLAWDLPDMPWDSAALYVAGVRDDGRLAKPRRIAGGADGAVFQPEWGPKGELYFVCDKTGWGYLYRWHYDRVARVHGRRGADLFRPQWAFGMRSYALGAGGKVGLVSLQRGSPLFEVRHLERGGVAQYRRLQARTARIDDPVAFNGGFAALVSAPLSAPAVMRIIGQRLEGFGAEASADVKPGDLSRGEMRSFRRRGGQPVHGIYYAPRSARFRGPRGSAPPALVLVHGGPTSMTDAGLKMRVQFYTSRGFAVLDVNYAGSTGYGRAYRERLDGQWGIADVEDCAAAARHLAKAGLADAGRIAISGGSAGGYTTLMALATTDAFAAGSSHYGVSDLALLLQHTHKFESGYLHRLMGTTPKSWKATFAKRSPINLIDGITAPVILFQGLGDKVVPPEQSRLIVDKLRRRGIDVATHEFAGEAHGFRKAETIIAVLEAELAFLQRVLRLG
ncbi:MAG TPA: prolyl oligopeptidase family serine peptidase [Hyphomicrobiaceae bacterium]|nr:prolyl oligopeptidase family serine peptidase [Hyphomicrobiaceae bacterium]